MRRTLLFLVATVVLTAAVVATINRLVDPENEFYSGAPLTAALESDPPCVVADNAVGAASYPEFKRDLFRRRRPTTVVLGSSRTLRIGPHRRETTFLNLGFPRLSPSSLLDMMRSLDGATPRGRRLTLYVGTDFAWFDPGDSAVHSRSASAKIGYLLDPRTFHRSLGLVRESRTLAFDGWRKERLGRTCVVDRGRAYRNWRVDGTRVYSSELAPNLPAPEPPRAARDFDGRGFAWARLSLLDSALAVAEARRWKVVGFATPDPTELARLGRLAVPWDVYAREMPALFAKHGFRYLDWRQAGGIPCSDVALGRGAYPPNQRCSRRMRRLLDAAARA